MNIEQQQSHVEELEARIIRLKARSFELEKESQIVHDELLILLGKVEGIKEAQNMKNQ